MTRKLHFFPEGVILLNKELATGVHPKLEAILSKHDSNDWELRLADIAAYCDVVIDSYFVDEDLNKLCAILSGRLQVLRELPAAQIILPFH